MSTYKIKIYIIGADEKSKKFELSQISKFDDDRILLIERELQNKLVNINTKIIKIPCNNGTECFLILIAIIKDN